MKKVLLVRSSTIPTRVLKEASSLASSGYAVSILYWNRDNNLSYSEEYDGITINYFGFKAPYGRPSLIAYMFVWWLHELMFLLKHHYDIVHACDFDTLVPAIVSKMLKHNKVVYDIFDFYSEALPSSIPSFVRKLVKRTELFCIQFTDATILVDESRFVQIKGAKVKKLEIIMNCPIDISADEFLIEERNIFTIFYGGTIAKDRGLDQLLNAIRGQDDICFIVAGTGPDLSTFEPMFSSMKNVLFIDWVNYKKYLHLTLEADAIFAYYDPVIPNNRLASSNKLFEAMMCAKPIIVNEETTMSELVQKADCGVVIPYNDTSKLRNTLLYLKNNRYSCLKLGKNGREAFEMKYNWSIMEQRLLQLYEKM